MDGFYTFEGIDGSGKSSVMKRVAELLMRDGRAVATTMEPTDTWLGKAVERSYDEPVSPYTEAFLFMADRATHSEHIRDLIADGKTVLCDRYAHSTFAYQGAALAHLLGGPEKAMEFLIDGHKPFILEPERVFLFDIDPEVGLERIAGREALSKFEKIEYLRGVRENYLALSRMYDDFQVIDASAPFEEVVTQVMKTFK